MRNKKRLENLLDKVLIVLAVSNIIYYIGVHPKQKLINISHPQKLPNNILRVPKISLNINYTQNEVDEAIKYLNLPTWSRGYIPCNSSKSEVTCEQVVHAARVIKSWEHNISTTPKDEKKYFKIRHPVKGMGNKMTTDVCGFILALMCNRTVIVTSNFPSPKGVQYDHIYEFPSSVLTSDSQLPEGIEKKYFASVNTADFSCFDVNSFLKSDEKLIGINDLLYAGMIYTNQATATWAYNNFGIHAAYFISNYFSRFPKSAIEVALSVLNKVPKEKKIFGMHVRYHRAGQYYSNGLNYTLPTLFEEVDRRIAGDPDLMLALATDNSDLKTAVVARYGQRVLMTDALRKPDRDHLSAMYDMALVLGSDEILASYRSTFSYIVVAKSGNSATWIEKESDHCFPASNSQAMCISMIYHHRDNCDWRTNDRVSICPGTDQEKALRLFFDYLVL